MRRYSTKFASKEVLKKHLEVRLASNNSIALLFKESGSSDIEDYRILLMKNSLAWIFLKDSNE